MQNTAEVRVGRLVEVRVAAGYRDDRDVQGLLDLIEGAVRSVPKGQKAVFIADWRRCPLMSEPAANLLAERLKHNNPRLLRSAALASTESPLAILQFQRLVREGDNADRRLFTNAYELVDWLSDVLDDAERARLREFCGVSAERSFGT